MIPVTVVVPSTLAAVGAEEGRADGGTTVADLVRYELDDGSTIYFESADGSLVSLRGGEPEIVDAGRLGKRLQHIAKAAGEIADSMRSTLTADDMQLQFGVKVASEAGIWFFSKVSGEGSISVTLTWRKQPSP
jgi:Trypsin-co-occurring domain 1